jgi:hypothetical protein
VGLADRGDRRDAWKRVRVRLDARGAQAFELLSPIIDLGHGESMYCYA